MAGLGFLAILSLILAHMQTGRANFASPGTWVWLLIFAAIGVLGAFMIRASLAEKS
jgi:hypothetical protein